MDALAEYLQQQGYAVIATREPGGTSISNQIREIVLTLKNPDIRARTEVLLFQAARAQLVEQVIRPHLQQGGVVICDRYADSTLAYQGYGQGGDLPTLQFLVDFATGHLKPDLTLLLDIDINTGLERRRTSGGEWNRLDAQAAAYYQRVRAGYLELAAAEPERWVVIDANRPHDRVQAELRRVILQRLKDHSQTPVT
jgi:dTMP kinase